VAKWAGKLFFSKRRSHFAESEKRYKLIPGSWKVVESREQLNWRVMGNAESETPTDDEMRKMYPGIIVKDGIVLYYRAKMDLTGLENSSGECAE